MKLLDTLSLSYRTIRGNKLRTGLTVAIIALGIAALIGIQTAIESMTQKFTESFSSMGANGFTLRFKPAWQIRFNKGVVKQAKGKKKEKKSSGDKPISKYQAERFKQDYNGKPVCYGHK
jgi:putative ABC transport system permease protein